MAKVFTSSSFVFGGIVIVLALHIFGIQFGWYDAMPYFDDIHHVIGGFWVTSLFFYLVRTRPRSFALGNGWGATIVAALGAAALAGIAWEFFEFGLDAAFGTPGIHFAQGDLKDTMGDLLSDLVGAAAFLLVYRPRGTR